MPRISPSRTSKSRLEPAVRPPNRFVSPFTSRMAAEGIVETDQTSRLQQNRSHHEHAEHEHVVVPDQRRQYERQEKQQCRADDCPGMAAGAADDHHEKQRSEEHTSELQSQSNLVCRLLLEKKKY